MAKYALFGDQAQLPPVGGPAGHDDGREGGNSAKTKQKLSS